MIYDVTGCDTTNWLSSEHLSDMLGVGVDVVSRVAQRADFDVIRSRRHRSGSVWKPSTATRLAKWYDEEKKHSVVGEQKPRTVRNPRVPSVLLAHFAAKHFLADKIADRVDARRLAAYCIYNNALPDMEHDAALEFARAEMTKYGLWKYKTAFNVWVDVAACEDRLAVADVFKLARKEMKARATKQKEANNGVPERPAETGRQVERDGMQHGYERDAGDVHQQEPSGGPIQRDEVSGLPFGAAEEQSRAGRLSDPGATQQE